MTEVPKIVQHRLRAGEAGRPESSSHPDADVLAAFAEQALSQVERDGVLGHLALCADCRDVMILALPAAEPLAGLARPDAPEMQAETAPSPVSERRRRNWFLWSDMRLPNLRWAALTAGVALVIFAVYVGLGHRGNPALPGTGRTAITAEVSAPASQIASQTPPQNSLEANALTAETHPEAPKEKSEISSGHMHSAIAKKNPIGQPGTLVANRRVVQAGTPDQQMVAPAAGGSASSAPGNANETVEASAATTEVATAFADGDVMARDQVFSVEKAKPPLEETVAGAGGDRATAHAPVALQTINGAFMSQGAASPGAVLKQGAMWMISAGLLKRSLDGGRGWQTVLEGQHPWLCYATHGQEVWAGGQAGALQHSNDGGTSWISIAVIAQGQPLDADVIQIDLQYPNIALTTTKHEMWRSSDVGKTWEKK